MAFCASCGADVQGKFCAKCGTPAGAAAAAPAGGAPPSSAPSAAGLDENVAAALCYLVFVLTGILFLVLEPYNRNRTIRFHAFQSIFYWIAVVILSIVLNIVSAAFAAVPFIGWIISILLWLVFTLGVVAAWLYLMYKAYNKERYVIPVIGPLAEKQAQS